MSHTVSIIASTALALALFASAPTVRAGDTFDTCAGFVDSVPATITTQGVWCLRKDLATAITSGNAITIVTNNVTIDCNGFKLGGLAAGKGSDARGIAALDRQNIAVRNCNIRGFDYGINLTGAGHIIRDNLFDQNLSTGIRVMGENNLVQHNRVLHTGGKLGATGTTSGIAAEADIIDNTVGGMHAAQANHPLTGIWSRGTGTRVSGNTVFDLPSHAVAGGATGQKYGIDTSGGGQMRLSGNHVRGHHVARNFIGIRSSDAENFCRDNTVAFVDTPFEGSCQGL